MRRDWRVEWYRSNPGGLVGRLRDLLRSRPEAAHALIQRLESAGWEGLAEDLQAPRSLCPVCKGEGEVLGREWEPCHTCGGGGLMAYPLTEWEEKCKECDGRGGWWAYNPNQPDEDMWVVCPECEGLGTFTRLSPAAYAERVEGRIAEDFPPDEPLPF